MTGPSPAAQHGGALTALLLLILALLIGLGGYWWWKPSAAPDLLRPYLQELPAAQSSRTLYRWQDGDGRWQISDKPPPQGEYETLSIPLDANVVPSAVPKDQ